MPNKVTLEARLRRLVGQQPSAAQYMPVHGWVGHSPWLLDGVCAAHGVVGAAWSWQGSWHAAGSKQPMHSCAAYQGLRACAVLMLRYSFNERHVCRLLAADREHSALCSWPWFLDM